MEGLDYCHEAGMRLASPEIDAEVDFIVDYMRNNGNKITQCFMQYNVS